MQATFSFLWINLDCSIRDQEPQKPLFLAELLVKACVLCDAHSKLTCDLYCFCSDIFGPTNHHKKKGQVRGSDRKHPLLGTV